MHFSCAIISWHKFIFGNYKLTTAAHLSGETLADVKYTHPTSGDEQRPLLPASHVTADVGTGLVHTAPAHGHDDFKVALQHDLSKVR